MTSVCQASDAEAPPSAFRLDRSYLNRLLEGPSRHRLKLPPALEADYQEYHYSDAAAHLRAYWPSVIVAISVLGGAMFAFDMISPDRRSLVVAGLIAFYVLAGVVAVSAYLPA